MFSPQLSESLSDYFVPLPPPKKKANCIIKEKFDSGCNNKAVWFFVFLQN